MQRIPLRAAKYAVAAPTMPPPITSRSGLGEVWCRRANTGRYARIPMPPLLLAATVTPLADDGEALDEAAVAPLADYLLGRGVDGLFCCGTTGEGVLLSVPERQRA